MKEHKITDFMVYGFLATAANITQEQADDLAQQWKNLRISQTRIKIMLKGQDWYIRNDGDRFWLSPGEDNPLIDRSEIPAMEYKHNDGPVYELADLIMELLEREFKKVYT